MVFCRRDDLFCPGVITAVAEPDGLYILFDGESTQQPLYYNDVLAGTEWDTVIADAAPNTYQVGETQ